MEKKIKNKIKIQSYHGRAELSAFGLRNRKPVTVDEIHNMIFDEQTNDDEDPISEDEPDPYSDFSSTVDEDDYNVENDDIDSDMSDPEVNVDSDSAGYSGSKVDKDTNSGTKISEFSITKDIDFGDTDNGDDYDAKNDGIDMIIL